LFYYRAIRFYNRQFEINTYLLTYQQTVTFRPALMDNYLLWQPAIVTSVAYFAFIVNYLVNKVSAAAATTTTTTTNRASTRPSIKHWLMWFKQLASWESAKWWQQSNVLWVFHLISGLLADWVFRICTPLIPGLLASGHH